MVGNHVSWFVPINILLNGALACYLYGIACKLSRAKAIGFLTGVMFLSSRMAYYQIGQVLGLIGNYGAVDGSGNFVESVSVYQ